MLHFLVVFNKQNRLMNECTYLSLRGGATTVVITRVFSFIHLVPAYELPRI